MAPSLYQSLKMGILEIIPVSKDAMHIYIGMAALTIALIFFKKKTSFALLIPTIAISFVMEYLDYIDDIRFYDKPMWKAYIHDIINTNLLPFITLLMVRIRAKRTE